MARIAKWLVEEYLKRYGKEQRDEAIEKIEKKYDEKIRDYRRKLLDAVLDTLASDRDLMGDVVNIEWSWGGYRAQMNIPLEKDDTPKALKKATAKIIKELREIQEEKDKAIRDIHKKYEKWKSDVYMALLSGTPLENIPPFKS